MEIKTITKEELIAESEVYVKDYQTSKELQLKAFELGFEWVSGKTKVLRYSDGFICFDSNMYMSWYKD